MSYRSLGVICLAFFLGGCASVGPDYRRPALEAPAQWTESQEKPGAALALEEIAWWQAFGDPVLNGLIDQAAKTNLDLEQARARIRPGAGQRDCIQGLRSCRR